MSFLSERVKFVKVQDHTTAGTTAVNSDGVDMAQSGGFRGVLFISSFGTAAAGNTMEVSQSQDNSSFADLLGTNTTSGTSDEDVFVDVYNPQERYVRAEVARGTSSTLESIWAILYDPMSEPVDNTTSGTIAGEAHVGPAEGTA
jgi:hypothetical protein